MAYEVDKNLKYSLPFMISWVHFKCSFHHKNSNVQFHNLFCGFFTLTVLPPCNNMLLVAYVYPYLLNYKLYTNTAKLHDGECAETYMSHNRVTLGVVLQHVGVEWRGIPQSAWKLMSKENRAGLQWRILQTTLCCLSIYTLRHNTEHPFKRYTS